MSTSRYFYQSISIILLLFLINDLSAQRVQANRWYFTADGGISVFFGDVKRYDLLPDWESPSEMQPMFSASFGREISPIFRLRGQFTYGELSGHKQEYHYNFTSTVIGGHLLTDINLIYLLTDTRFGRNRINIFASLGLGYLSWDTYLNKDNGDYMGESKMGNLSIPGSISIEYLFTQNFSVKGEGYLYVLTSDEVDAKVGGIEVDMISYFSLGATFKFKTKRKAKQRKIKYALDPALYEPRVEVTEDTLTPIVEQPKEEIIEEEVPETVEEEPVVTPVIPEEEIVLPVEVVLVEVAKEEEQEEETPAKFVIDHELETEAIKKEQWTPPSQDPWPEIEFTVQILAAKNKKEVADLQKLYGVKDRIVERYDGVWYRYSVGRYDKIWRARELRNVLISRNNIDDAFIAVYKNNVRISLQETMDADLEPQKPKEEPQIEQETPQPESSEEVYPLIRLRNSVPYTDGVIFGVQVLSIKNDHYRLGELKGVHQIDRPILVSHVDTWYQIVVHGFDTYEEANAYQKIVNQKGFTDSFVVAFKNGKKIELTDLVD